MSAGLKSRQSRAAGRSWRSRGHALLLALVGISAATGGCATYSDRTEAARTSITAGDYEGGLKEYNRYLKVRKPEELPKKLHKSDMALAVLERASLLQAMKNYELSRRDFQAAEKELELLDIAKDTAGNIGKYLYSDSATKYKTPPVERLSLNAMNMINYLVKGDVNGARVEAKRFTVMRNYLKDYDPKHAHGAFGSYLAGFVMERLGENDSALRYYDEALEGQDLGSLREPIVRLGSRSSYRTERLEAYLTPDPAAPQAPMGTPAELMVVVKVGRVPYKVPKRIPIGLAVGMAGTFITGNPAVLERAAMKFLTFPELVPAGNLFNKAAVKIDGHPIATEMVTDLGKEIVREYEESKPKMIGAALTRMITRALVAEGARAAGNQANGAVGIIAALAVEGTMVAMDKPDTRSWTLLPDRVFIARTGLPAGEHQIEISTSGPGGRQRRKMKATVADGQYLVVDVTTLR